MSAPSIRILEGDALAVLSDIPDASVDCVVTDPPYGETAFAWDKWPVGWPAAVLPKLKSTGSMWVFGSMAMFWDNIADFGEWRRVQEIVWEKHNGSGFANDRFRRVHEFAVQFVPKSSRWAEIYKLPQVTNDAKKRSVRRNGKPAHWTGCRKATTYVSEDGGPRLMRSVQYVRSEHGSAVHPTQKPLAIVEPLVRYSCPENGTLLDLFAGSGTTAIAGAQIGAQSILIEADPAHLVALRERVCGDLFSGAAMSSGALEASKT